VSTARRYAAIIEHCLPKHNAFVAASCFYAWIDVIQVSAAAAAEKHFQ
jgi:hypothetical protein